MSEEVARRRERVAAYKAAFGAENPAPRLVRLAVWLGLAPLARVFLSDAFWLSVVLADLAKTCHANETTYTISTDDPHGRHSAMLEGRRQVYLEIRHFLALTPKEEARILESLASDEKEIQAHAS